LGYLELRELFFGFGPLADVFTENGVDESRLRPESKLPGQIHRFIHGGVVGDATEPEELVKAELKEDAQHILLVAALCSSGNEPVQSHLPAHDAINQLLAESAIGSGKSGGGNVPFKQSLCEFGSSEALF